MSARSAMTRRFTPKQGQYLAFIQELLLFLTRRLREAGTLPEPRLFSEEQLKAWMDEDEEDMRRLRAGQ